MKKINKVIITLIALMIAFTIWTAAGLYILLSGYCGDSTIVSILIGAIYPVGIIAGIATIKYELED